MTNQPALDQAKMEAFVGKVLGDTSGMTVTLMAYLGDRLGLFKDLETHGPATCDQLADRAGINDRYAREWLSAMACAGYLEYDPGSSRFTLPPEHAPVLAQEYGPFFFAVPLRPTATLRQQQRKPGLQAPSQGRHHHVGPVAQ